MRYKRWGFVLMLLAGSSGTAAGQQSVAGTWTGTTELILPSDDGTRQSEFGLGMQVTEADSGVTARVELTPPGGDAMAAEFTGEHRRDGHLVLRGNVQGADVVIDAAPDGGGALFGHLSATAGDQVVADGSLHVRRDATPRP